MSLFKQQIANDVNTTFMNIDEFSNYHKVNGKRLIVQVDSNELIDRQQRYQQGATTYSDGIFLKEILIYVRSADLDNIAPKVGSIINFDGKDYTVSDVADEMGIYSIELQMNKSVRR